MNWKTAMNLDLIEVQGDRRNEHDLTTRTLENLIQRDPEHADLYRGCLAKLESGYDL